MKKSLFWLATVCLLLSSTIFMACEDDDDITQPDLPDIVEFAQDDPNFSMLAEAIVKTGLDGILSGAGPFTLFAPPNSAFQAYLDAAGTGTVANTPNDVLTTVLTNHVLSGEFLAVDLFSGYATTLSTADFGEGINLTLYVNTTTDITINGDATITEADELVSNGVIHTVDAVIAPPTLVTFATANPQFSALVSALTAAGMTTDFLELLTSDGPFTVFAPTNAAFQTLLDSNSDWSTVDDIPAATLENVLRYHVTDAGNIRAEDLTNGQQVTTLAGGDTFTINLDNPNVPRIMAGSNMATVIAVNIQAQNGVIHAIDNVILPE